LLSAVIGRTSEAIEAEFRALGSAAPSLLSTRRRDALSVARCGVMVDR
jgi:hypothetical protein